MRSRRATELWLLIAATPVLLLLFLMLLVNANTPLTFNSFAVPIALVASFVIAHIALRKFAPNADPALLPIAFLLCGIGICFVLRLAPDTAGRQIVWLFAGIALMIATIILVPSVERLGRYKYTCLLFGLLLLLLPITPFIGVEYNGSRIWLSIAGMSFQPGEIAKILIVLFLAAYLTDNRELLSVMRRSRIGLKYPDFRALIPLIAMWVIAMLIVVFERDLGSALLFFGIFLVMIYVCTGRLSYVIIGVGLVALGGFGLYKVFSHVQTRIAIWLSPFSDPSGSGYQLVQSLYSLADGGLFGTGIGRGMPTYIPEVQSDFIFSAIGEELGLLGASGVIFLFMLFAVRGFLIAARAKSDMAAFTAVGLTTSICLQAFIIIGGVTGFIPLTGLTLPFMSQGGSSLLSSFIIVGLLLCAGNEGTGLQTEMTSTTSFKKPGETGVLGRSALGKRLTWLIAIFALLFAGLIANLTFIQAVRANEIQDMNGNNHTLQRIAQQQRGAILTSDNVVLAQSALQSDGTYKRTYPQGTLASHAIGYSSQRYGSTGVENSMGTTLVGQEHFETIGDAIRSYAGEKPQGNDVVVTLDSQIQQAAEASIAGQKGACVVLDTSTGAVLAEASSPTYDNNNVESVIKNSNSDGDLVNRATQTLYAPGSTFKIVTLAGALDTGTVKASTVYSSPSSISIGNASITNYHSHAYGNTTVEEATALSSNTAFAQIADDLGSEALVSYAKKFGFNNSSLALDFSLSTSLMPDPAEMTQWETAWAGVGQPVGEHQSPAGPQATVMQMAVCMSAIANNGVAVHPYIIQKVVSASGATTYQTQPQILGQVISEKTAQTEREILSTVVTSGTGTQAQVDGANVIGKTGTAETGKANSDAWFVGTAEANGKSVTVAIIIEQGDSGGDVAAPKASNVFNAALSRLGAL
jgi:cell division protein FtsW (lipid II flippase)/cell division protein FtsI/penicillin-binding protein 2